MSDRIAHGFRALVLLARGQEFIKEPQFNEISNVFKIAMTSHADEWHEFDTIATKIKGKQCQEKELAQQLTLFYERHQKFLSQNKRISKIYSQFKATADGKPFIEDTYATWKEMPWKKIAAVALGAILLGGLALAASSSGIQGVEQIY